MIFSTRALAQGPAGRRRGAGVGRCLGFRRVVCLTYEIPLEISSVPSNAVHLSDPIVLRTSASSCGDTSLLSVRAVSKSSAFDVQSGSLITATTCSGNTLIGVVRT